MLESQYLTFSLGNERYAIPVGRVLEVLEYSQVTRLPGAERFMKGLINLRGKGIPVLDLRLRFGMTETPMTRETATIVVEIAGEDHAMIVGILVDAVHEVVEIDSASISPAPRLAGGPSCDFLTGIARRGDGFALLLDTDRLFSAADIEIPAPDGDLSTLAVGV
jgi:purine-binding chemotaxis protein CheW